MFTQVGRSIDRSQGGLGIGLTLVRRLVEMHGGSIAAHSAGIAQGSTFTVRIPLARSILPEATGDGHAAQPAGTNALRVLVVDDNVDAADSLALLLRASGHTVARVHDGARAVETVERWQPDVVLLDIGLPGMSGYDVARALRRAGARTRLVALTGYGQQADRQQTRQAGFDDHLVKPATAKDIRRVLETAVARS